jgi:hypothetical protein
MFELRYLIRQEGEGSEKVLQYRQQIVVNDYNAKTDDGTHILRREWTNWKPVPSIVEA